MLPIIGMIWWCPLYTDDKDNDANDASCARHGERQMNQPDFVRDIRAHVYNLNVHKFTVITEPRISIHLWLNKTTVSNPKRQPCCANCFRKITYNWQDRFIATISTQITIACPYGLLATKSQHQHHHRQKTSPAASTIDTQKKAVPCAIYIFLSASVKLISKPTTACNPVLVISGEFHSATIYQSG